MGVFHESLQNCYSEPSSDFGMFFSAGLFDFELTHAILTRLKSNFRTVFGIKPFLPNRAQRPDKYSPTWNFMANPMVVIRCLGCVGFKSFFGKNLEKIEKNHENSRIFEKIRHFSALVDVFCHIDRSKKKL